MVFFRSYLFSNEADCQRKVDLVQMSGIVNQWNNRFLYGKCNCFRIREYLLLQSKVVHLLAYLVCFLYYHETRNRKGTIQEDRERMFVMVWGFLKNIGGMPEEDFPYTENFRDKPSPKLNQMLHFIKLEPTIVSRFIRD